MLTGESNQTIAQIARAYKSKGIGSIVVGDENYGEGSSRSTPRCRRAFERPRGHYQEFCAYPRDEFEEAGHPALTFADAKDYDKIEMNDRLSVVDLANLAPGKPVAVIIHKAADAT